MEVSFLPLELWRASSLAQETKTVVAAYDRCLASGDMAGLAALRAAIEKRIEDLETFYIAHVDDERSVLFEKQRLKLRKLLHEYDAVIPPSASAPASTTVAGAAGRDPLVASSAASAAAKRSAPTAAATSSVGIPPGVSVDATGLVTREIREDTRLTAPELLAWFEQAGVAEMPEVTSDIVDRVFTNVTRTNMDGRMSVRDLRQWYITFGKRAIRERVPLDDIVSVSLVKAGGVVAVTARKEDVHKRTGIDLLATTVAPAGAGAGLSTSGRISTAGGAGGGGGTTSTRKAMYSWETTSPSGGEDATTPGGRVTLPNGMVEFQVRLSADEHAMVQLLRRRLDAEGKYKARIAAAKDKAASMRGEAHGPTFGETVASATKAKAADAVPFHYAATSLIHEGPYEEPNRNSYFYRSP